MRGSVRRTIRAAIALTSAMLCAAPLCAEPVGRLLLAQAGGGAAPPLPAGSATSGTEGQPSALPLNEEEQQTIALLVELQRYAGESNDELRRELVASLQALNRARTDANRIRAAILLTLPGAGPPDDARAITLLESVSGRTPASSPLKQLASVLLTQISERQRGMSEERRKSAAAQEKLDQLRAVERSLLLERNRNSGGAGGGGGGGGTGR